MQDFIILGGGIAGLASAYELLKRGQRVVLIEKGNEVGGLARTFVRDGFRFDLGGHRFHSNNPAVIGWLKELLPDELETVQRLSHIYLNGRFVNYPLAFPNALTAFGLAEAAQMAASYAASRLTAWQRPDESFEDWVIKRFGMAMYRAFFQPYTEKVWGIPCDQLSAEWAAQRIGLPSPWKAIKQAILPAAWRPTPATAVSHFYYPRSGFGAIAQALRREIENLGGRLYTGATATSLISHAGGFELNLQQPAGPPITIQAAEVISTIPLEQLLALLPAEPARQPLLAQRQLDYRGLICVFLALKKEQITPDSWTYFPDKDFIFGRTHEPKNWSGEMVPHPAFSSLAVEIFASPQDSLWRQADETIIGQVVAQLSQLGWFTSGQVHGRWLLRIPHAYPVYRVGYRARLEQVRAYLNRWPCLHLLGRTGSFRYMNSDGVIEDVFRFIANRWPADPGTDSVIQPLVSDNGRWV
jgi:protoporphyrinogen oxidase